ncbi:MAG: single-stranded DNA-binding protein [Clostridia bacterium]|nr:single-stranded DNA-binding protein [Clostridia bacterium]MBR6186719.1 single-stranded DNA-binding protein [Clostridia bacterium]
MESENNQLTLCGVIDSAPVMDHEVFGEHFYRMDLRVPRLSGTQDVLPVTVSERLMNSQIVPGVRVAIQGQLRSYNKVLGGAGRLLLTAFAQRLLAPDEDENPNMIHLTGAICKPPAFRTTPFGREISDLMLAVNRAFGKSDYIPCIAWGRTARYASQLRVGDHLEVQGRFQSREYQKQMPDGAVMNRMAYEVSISRLSRVSDLPLPAQPLAERENALQ